MAIYHLSVKTISRSSGRSATASAAYRAAEKIEDLRTGLVHDYTRKRGVESATVILPAQAPAWAINRQALWNAAEQAESRKNSTVAREFEIALPSELTAAQRRDLAHAFAWEIVTRHGCAADVAIHAPTPKSDERNHHAHILLTTRRLDANGFTEKTRELDDRRSGEIEHWRRQWAVITNRHLERAGQVQRIDHRTLAAQGIEQPPTRHLGSAATEYEHRTGQPSRRRLETDAGRQLAEIHHDLSQTQRELEQATLYVGDLQEAQREHAQAVAEERAEWERQRQAEERQARERQAQQARAEQARIERMTAAELAAEIQRLTPHSVEDVLNRHPNVIEPRFEAMQLGRELMQAQTAVYRAQREAAHWRDAHPLRAHLHRLGVSQPYLAERERIKREQTQRGQVLRQARDQADQQARQVIDRLRPVIIAEQQQTQARLAALETQRQAKAAQEQAQERLQAARPPKATPKYQERPQAAQKPLQATSRPRAAPEHQERSQPTQERPLTALEQEKAQRLREAFDTLDKRTAMLRFPELTRLYPLVAEATLYAKEHLHHPQNRANFIAGIKEKGIQQLARGETLPALKPSLQPESKIERKREQDYSPGL